MLWVVMLLLETFRNLDGEGSAMAAGDVQPSLCRIELATKAMSWKVAIDGWQFKCGRKSEYLISAQLPTIKDTLEDYNVPLGETEQLMRKVPDHEVMLGIDANTKVCGFEDGWDQTPSQHSLFERNRRELPLAQIFYRAQVSFLGT